MNRVEYAKAYPVAAFIKATHTLTDNTASASAKRFAQSIVDNVSNNVFNAAQQIMSLDMNALREKSERLNRYWENACREADWREMRANIEKQQEAIAVELLHLYAERDRKELEAERNETRSMSKVDYKAFRDSYRSNGFAYAMRQFRNTNAATLADIRIALDARDWLHYRANVHPFPGEPQSVCFRLSHGDFMHSLRMRCVSLPGASNVDKTL